MTGLVREFSEVFSKGAVVVRFLAACCSACVCAMPVPCEARVTLYFITRSCQSQLGYPWVSTPIPNTGCMAACLHASNLDLRSLQCARHGSGAGQALLLRPERGVPASDIIDVLDGADIWDPKAEGLPGGCIDGQGPRDAWVNLCCRCWRPDRVEGYVGTCGLKAAPCMSQAGEQEEGRQSGACRGVSQMLCVAHTKQRTSGGAESAWPQPQ